MAKKHTFLKVVLVTAATLGTIYVINRLIEKHAVSGHMLTANPNNYYRWNKTDVYYTKEGSGKPLLLIHDLTTYSSAYEWERVRAALAKDHTVYTVDLPGCGRSEKPCQTYIGFYFVQFITDFLRDVVGEKCDIAATCASSALTISSASFDSTYIDRIILVNPSAINRSATELSRMEKVVKFCMELPILGQFAYNIRNSARFIEDRLTERFFYNPFHVTSRMVETCTEAAHLGKGGGRYLLSSLQTGYINIDVSAAISAIKNPILILSGQACSDQESIVDLCLAFNSSVEHVTIEKSGRFPQIEEPESFVAAAEHFLNANADEAVS